MATALACMDDLLFLSKIMEAAKALGVPLRSLKSPEKLVAAARESDGPVVFLDLDDTRLDALIFARAVRAADPPLEAKIYAFVSHVNEGRITAATPDLFDRVFSRGQFVQALPALLETPPLARG